MDEGEVAAWRRARRTALIGARLALPAAQHQQASAAIIRNLAAYVARPGGVIGSSRRSLGFYWPVRGEVDLRPFVESQIAEGCMAALPVLPQSGGPLLFRTWRPGAPTALDAYAIPYPVEGETIDPDLLLVPLVGFDDAGYRLGYGGGHYDRTIAAMQAKPEAIGIGFELGRLATIWPQPYDIAMDAIITESGVRRRGRQGLAPP